MPDATRLLAQDMLVWAHRYLGSSYAEVDQLLKTAITRFPEVSALLEQYKSTHTPDAIRRATRETVQKFITDAASAAMEGRRVPAAMYETTLAFFYPVLKMPYDLRHYAVNMMLSVKLYGKRDEAIDDFPNFYNATALPILKERLEGFGVSPADIQRAFREHPELNPVYAIWFLGGVVPPVARNNGYQLSSETLRFAEVILGKNPDVLNYGPKEVGPIDSRPLRALLDIDRLPSRDTLFEGVFAKEGPAQFDDPLLFTRPLPNKLNDQFDADRTDAIIRSFSHGGIKAGDSGLPKTLGLGSTSPRNVGKYFIRTRKPFPLVLPPSFFDMKPGRAHEEDIAADYSWEKIPEFLRRKFEIAGYDSAKKIVDAIKARPEQIEIMEHPRISLRHNLGETGHVVTEILVLATLMQPEGLHFYGFGMGTNLLHDEMRRMVEPETDNDTFYGQEKRVPKTVEQTIVAGFCERLNEAARKAPLVQHAVTEQQRAGLIGMWADEIFAFMRNLDQAYGSTPNTPHEKLIHIREKLGVSISFEECVAIREEKRQAAIAARQAAETARAAEQALKRNQRKARGQSSAIAGAASTPQPRVALPKPWADIPLAIAEFCVRKGYVNFDAVVAAIEARIAARIESAGSNGRARNTSRHVRLALENLPNGFLISDYRPINPMYAHMQDLLRLRPAEMRQLRTQNPGKSRSESPASQIQANIVEKIRYEGRFSHIVSWTQFAQEYGAEVFQLTGNLDGAYRLLRPGELSITPNPTLSNIVSALNKGSAQQPVTPDEIVSRETWLSTYRSRHVNSAIPPDIKAADLIIG